MKHLIMSATESDRAIEYTAYDNKLLGLYLDGLGVRFSPGFGSYHGSTEHIFAVEVTNRDQYNAILDFVFEIFNQESVLVIDENLHAHLVFSDSNRKEMGMLTKVDSSEGLTDYTCVQGEIYTTVRKS